jgi:hypothetical protein
MARHLKMEGSKEMESWHMLGCAALIAIGAVLVPTGASFLALIPALACAVMMGGMAWTMIRSGGRGGGE